MALDIQQLAESVLSQAAASIKTASVEEPTALQTEIGRGLKQAAASIRAIDDLTPTNTDLENFRTAQHKTATDHAVKTLPLNGSLRGNYFRKLANDLRESGVLHDELRAIKTAKIVNAAVALQHLGGK